MSKRKHKSASLEEKLSALKRLDQGERIKKVAQDLGVGAQTVGDWKKNRAKLEAYCDKNITSPNGLGTKCTMRQSETPELDECLFTWFTEHREVGLPMSGPILQQKARIFNRLLNGDPSFTASNGWLSRWKKRHGIKHSETLGTLLSDKDSGRTDAQNESQQQLDPSSETEQNSSKSDEASEEDLSTEDADLVTVLIHEESEDECAERITHTQGAAALDVALQYIEQQKCATATDIMLMKKWQNFAEMASQRENVPMSNSNGS